MFVLLNSLNCLVTSEEKGQSNILNLRTNEPVGRNYFQVYFPSLMFHFFPINLLM